MPKPLLPPETFWRQVDRCAHPPPCPDCCWPWRGTTTAQGYGAAMRTLFGHQETYAHRIAWILHHGRRPRRGHHIAVTCGLPACCNWMHLQEQRPQATQAAYLRSARVAQRRRPVGPENPNQLKSLTFVLAMITLAPCQFPYPFTSRDRGADHAPRGLHPARTPRNLVPVSPRHADGTHCLTSSSCRLQRERLPTQASAG